MPKLPSQKDAFDFICGTHLVERININYSEVDKTYNGTAKILNPYVDGHLRAMTYIFDKLVGKQDFPARSPKFLTNRFKSDVALNWLKDLNSIMLTPLVGHPMLSQDPNTPQRQFIGVWRQIPAMNTFSVAPQPELIPKLMHTWLCDIATLNEEVFPLLNKPYDITKEKAHLMEQTAYNASMFIAVTQPFTYANNRLGRLVENALRLHWHFPWKPCSHNHIYEQYIKDLVTFQQHELPKLIARTKDLIT